MASCKPKVKAVANIAKNRMSLTISGNVDAKTMNALYTDIRFCVADLQPGFIVIEDFSECNLFYISGLTVYKKIMDYLVANRVGEIIRVVQDTISQKQIQNYSEGIQCYKTMYADQIEKAEKKLQETIRRDGIRFKLNGSHIEYTHNGHVYRGTILDLSISGCAVGAKDEVPAVGQELPFALFFANHDIHPSHFSMNAKVVRANASTFAVYFLDLGDERREQLHQRLAYEVGRTVALP